jgi:hypothetical protein
METLNRGLPAEFLLSQRKENKMEEVLVDFTYKRSELRNTD